MDEQIKIVIRPGVITDHGFVASTWAKGIYYGSPDFNEIPEDVFYKWFPRITTRILRRPDTQVTIACDAERPNWIVACAAFDRDSLYWIYVKDGFRNQGIASLLIKDRGLRQVRLIAAITKPGFAIAEQKSLALRPI